MVAFVELMEKIICCFLFRLPFWLQAASHLPGDHLTDSVGARIESIAQLSNKDAVTNGSSVNQAIPLNLHRTCAQWEIGCYSHKACDACSSPIRRFGFWIN